MLHFLTHLFDTTGFPPRWHCGTWTTGHGWLHIVSDLAVWSAYVTIPCVLGYFVLRKQDIPFRKIFWLFGAFILACGTTHLMEVLMFWWPAYRLAGVIKLITGIVSWATVLALLPATPKVLAMRNPEELEREIGIRKQAEQALQEVNAELERRLQELAASEERLRQSMGETMARKRNEEELRQREDHLSSELEAMTQLHALSTQLLSCDNLRTALDNVLDSAILASRADFGNIQLYDPKRGVLEFISQRGFQQEFLDHFQTVRVEGGSTCAQAMQTGARVIIEDVHLDPAHEPHRHISDAAGYRAVQSTPLKSRSGAILGMLSTHFRQPHTPSLHHQRLIDLYARQASDVIERIRADEELARLNRELEFRLGELQTVFDVLPVGVAVAHDRECQHLTLNSAMSRFLGVTTGGNVSLTSLPQSPPLQYTVYQSGTQLLPDGLPMHVAARTGSAIDDLELDVVESTGERRKLLCYARPLPGENGETRGSIGAFLDITERTRQESQLREKLREFDTLMDVAPVAIVITYDPACRTITGNRAASELLKVPLRGNLSKSAPPEEQPPFHVYRNGQEVPAENLGIQVAAARGIAVRNEEQELRFHDGTVRHIVCNASPLFDDEGQVRGCIGALVDVTERKQAEEAMQAADRRKDEFLATLAHELRNPLTPISNALQVWNSLRDDPSAMENLRGLMDRQVRQMIRLIDDLLDVARISKGKIQLRKQRADLGTVVTEAVEALQPIISDCGHDLSVSLPDQPLIVVADVARLTQIFGNILHNAAKYTERNGRIQIHVAAEGANAVVRISDNGPGIPRDMLTRIFDAFQQVDQTLNRAHGGLGIGLTLVKRLIELHGGTVEALSAGPGTGSEFLVTLPRAPDLEVEAPDAGGRGQATVPRHRVLVVDDVGASAKTLAMMLQAIGQEVSTKNDGPSAIEWIQTHRPDVVFLDIAMPGMDGYEVARRLRALTEFNGLFLVALTGYGQEEDRRRATEAGFNYHLTKPTSIDTLQHLLSTLASKPG